MGKKKTRLIDRLKKVPHLFAKCIIVHCIIVVTVAAYFSLIAQAKGADMVALYTAVAATFVSELAMLLLKTLFKKETNAQTSADFNSKEGEECEADSFQQNI